MGVSSHYFSIYTEPPLKAQQKAMDNYNHSAIHGFPTKTTNVNVLILFMVQLKA